MPGCNSRHLWLRIVGYGVRLTEERDYACDDYLDSVHANFSVYHLQAYSTILCKGTHSKRQSEICCDIRIRHIMQASLALCIIAEQCVPHAYIIFGTRATSTLTENLPKYTLQMPLTRIHTWVKVT
jgi:hypothetical protein